MADYLKSFAILVGVFALVVGVIAPIVIGAMTNNPWWLAAYMVTGPAFLAAWMDF